MTNNRQAVLLTAVMIAMAFGAYASSASAPPPLDVEMKTLTYASRGGQDLVLDLYLPQKARGRLPVIVFLHGGGWSGGTRTTGPDFKRFFAQDGFAVASIEYRLTPSITFPSNVEDVKTAIRWLRANHDTYGLDPGRIGIWGTSAGGHLAAIAGLAPRGTFEGEDNLTQSSAVQCVLDAYRADGLQPDGCADGAGESDAAIAAAGACSGASHARRSGRRGSPWGCRRGSGWRGRSGRQGWRTGSA